MSEEEKELEYYENAIGWYESAIQKYHNPNFDNSDAMCSENHLLIVEIPYYYRELLTKLTQSQHDLKVITTAVKEYLKVYGDMDNSLQQALSELKKEVE